jgi:two-component system, NarL family, sensor kinase
MKKIVIALSFFFVNYLGFSQNPMINQLKKEIGLIKTQKVSLHQDSLLLEKWRELSDYGIYFRDINAKAWVDSVGKFNLKKNLVIAEGIYNLQQGNFLIFINNDYPKAIQYFFRAEKLFRNQNDDYHLCLSLLGIIRVAMWNSGKGEDLFQGYSNLVKSSREYGEEAIQLAEKLKDPSLICLANTYVANLYMTDLSQKAKYKKLILEAEKALENSKDYYSKAMFYITAMDFFMAEMDETPFLKYGNLAILNAEKTKDYYVLNRASINNLLWNQNNSKKYPIAEKYGLQSLAYAKKYQSDELISDTEYHLFNFYQKIGQYQEALDYLLLYNKHENEINRGQTQKEYDELQTSYQAQKQQSKISELENDKLKERQNFLYILGVIVLLLIGYVGWVNINLSKKNKLLFQKNQEIEEALVKGQNIERKRVAEELHDNLSAKISGIRWRLEAISPQFAIEKEQKIFDSTVNALAEVYTDVRLIAHNLLPAELETKGLPAALKNLSVELNSQDRTLFKFKNSDNIERFANKIEYEIYSIILELSNNILKHAKAKNAMIILEKLDKTLKLIVSDDGIGIDQNSAKKGMGMGNLKSRVASLNGIILIENQEGLRVEISVPI